MKDTCLESALMAADYDIEYDRVRGLISTYSDDIHYDQDDPDIKRRLRNLNREAIELKLKRCAEAAWHDPECLEHAIRWLDAAIIDAEMSVRRINKKSRNRKRYAALRHRLNKLSSERSQ